MTMTLPELFQLNDQVALITGGANGIGKLAATTLAQAGAKVLIADIEADSARLCAEELNADGGKAESTVLDVSDEQSVIDVFAGVAEQYARLDILVNSAGVAKRMACEETPLDIWNKVIAVNLTGTFLCCREAGKIMLKQGSGSIINLASIMGHVGGGLYPNASYHATKGGVVNLTRALAAEWGDRGVRVNDIAPTFVNTRFAAAVNNDPVLRPEVEKITPLGRIAEVDDLAGAFLYLASGASKMVTGHSLAVDGGWLAR